MIADVRAEIAAAPEPRARALASAWHAASDYAYTHDEIRAAVADGAVTVDDLVDAFRAGLDRAVNP